MLDRLGIRRSVLLQHVVHQVDAAARAIQFVPEQHVGRTGRGAETATHAGADDAFRSAKSELASSSGAKFVCMGPQMPAYMRPGLRTRRGSKLSFTSADKDARGPGSGSNTGTAAHALRARSSVPCPPPCVAIVGPPRRRHRPCLRRLRPIPAAPVEIVFGVGAPDDISGDTRSLRGVTEIRQTR